MYCTHCGTKLDEDAKFCTKCGEKVKTKKTTKADTKVKNDKDTRPNGTIRKAIKKDAKLKNKNPLILTMLILIPAIAITVIAFENAGNSDAISMFACLIFICVFALTIIVNFGIIWGSLQISKGKDITIGDIFTNTFKKIKNILLYVLFTILICFAFVVLYAIPILNVIVAIVGSVAIPILSIYFYPMFETLCYIIMDSTEDKPFLSCVKEAYELVKGKRVEFYGMYFSFIGWYLLSGLTFGILYIWTIPYLKVSVANMYHRWALNTNFEGEEPGLSNGGIIGLFVGGYLIFIFIMIIFMISLFAFGTYINNKNSDTNINSELDDIYNQIIEDYNIEAA